MNTTESFARPLVAPPALSGASLVQVAIPLAAVGMLIVPVSSGIALLLGIGIAIALGNPWPGRTRTLAHRALTWSVVGLGAGMNLHVVARVGLHGLVYTAIGIGTALLLGTLLGRWLHVARDTSLLVTVGTAICGGSAIAAVAPAIGAKDHDVSIALATVFLLNAVALFVFPPIGHALALGQDSFGLWCALAIHDTSSVVGAAAQYGSRALEVATSAKLARALWIVPVTFVIATARAREARERATEHVRSAAEDLPRKTPKRPWFIAGFLAAAALVTFAPALHGAGMVIAAGSHRLLAVSLFLIGLGLTRTALRSVGLRPLLQAVFLWATLALGTLLAIVQGWIG